MGEHNFGFFDHGFSRLEATLQSRERMQAVHSSNIANADTPNYRADGRTFDDYLNARLNGSAMPLATSQAGHMQLESVSRHEPEWRSGGDVQRADGNTVDLQKEMARMSENQLMHELSLRMIRGRINILTNAIKEGSR